MALPARVAWLTSSRTVAESRAGNDDAVAVERPADNGASTYSTAIRGKQRRARIFQILEANGEIGHEGELRESQRRRLI